MKKISGDPRKRQTIKAADLARKSEAARRMTLLRAKENEFKTEILRLLDIFEGQYPESPGYCYDEQPYILIFSVIVMHRAGCELNDEPEKYDPFGQLDTLELLPEMRREIEEFLLRNHMDKAKTYSVFG